MPRKQLVEYICDRCGRKWYPEKDEGTAQLQIHFTLSANSSGSEVNYEVLCSSCEKAVVSHLASISHLRHQSPQRGAKKKKGVPVAPEAPPEKGRASKS